MIGDIVLTRKENVLGKLIRFFSQHGGESRTKVNHVGVMYYGDRVLEAVDHVRITPFKKKAGDSVAIYRMRSLSYSAREAIVREAYTHLGERYGYLKIVAHFLDWMLFGAYVFRRIACLPNYPICSWLVADAYKEVGASFGVPVGAAEPDDIWDHIQAHPEIYECIRPLSLYTGA